MTVYRVVSELVEADASDPSMSPVALSSLAFEYPDQVLANPSLPLIALSDPAAWREIVGGARIARARFAMLALLQPLRPEQARSAYLRLLSMMNGWSLSSPWREEIARCQETCDRQSAEGLVQLLMSFGARADRDMLTRAPMQERMQASLRFLLRGAR